MYMGMLAKQMNSIIINIADHFYFKRNEVKYIKTKEIQSYGIQRFWFVLEYSDFNYYWNLMLLNEPIMTSKKSTIQKSHSFKKFTRVKNLITSKFSPIGDKERD